ncbi:MAG TPA: DUF1592 domain-containing protein [Blastocatellia bacterium]|nr:DUF1592 domain-containing protein [Blastocatellia bacterium]
MKTVKTLFFIAFLLMVGMAALKNSDAQSAVATQSSATTPLTLLRTTCGGCHNDTTRAGGLDLKALPFDLSSVAARAPWVEIYDRIQKREMPPNSASLSEENWQALLKWLGKAFSDADRADVLANGRGPMRRLNRDEYEQNLRDLLQLPHLDIRDMLPEDRESHHYNKVSEALDMSRVQLSAYLDATEVALQQAMATSDQPPTVARQKAVGEQLSVGRETTGGREAMFWVRDAKGVDLAAEKKAAPNKPSPDPTVEMALFRSPGWPYGIFPRGIVAQATGDYRVRFSARAVLQIPGFVIKPGNKPVPMTFRSRKPTNHDIAEDTRSTGGIIDVQPEGGVYETTVRLNAGQTIEYGLLGLPAPQPDVKGMTAAYRFAPFPADGHPGIAFQWLEMEGPLMPAAWPPPSHRVLFDDLGVGVKSQQPAADAKRLLRRFIKLAEREPVPEEALQSFEKLVLSRLERGATLAESLLAGYQAFLCSDLFLYLREPQRVDDHFAIAQRLSHFLTDSRPDAALLTLASQKKLRNAAVLRRETERLLASDEFARFVNHFTDSWLNLRALRRDDPDIRLYPEYRLDDYLVESAGMETRAFFTAMIRENLPATTVIDSDFTFVNDRLAKHYKLAPLTGSALRKVTLPADSPYGGLLTQAAILKVSANGLNTSPVLRGVWVMDRLMGQPPPPPPPGVPAVEPDIRGAKTMRELIAQHTKSASCAACHAKFDSVGLALENFDVLGAWRTRYRGLENGERVTGIDQTGHDFSYTLANPVDASGKLVDGRSFKDVHGLKEILASNPRQLARNLLHQFTIYATGVPVRFGDRAEIETMLDACAKDGYRVRDLLLALTQSKIFLGPKGCQ